LWKKGITSIDTLVLTHPDADHTGGAAFLIENFRIGRLWIPDADGEPPGFAETLSGMEEKGHAIEKLDAGASPREIGGVRIEALNPPTGVALENLSDNDLSLVLRLTYEETSLLLGGDAGKDAFRFVIDSGKDLGSEILKAPHHGLESGFSRQFVDLVRPRLVVISGKTHRINQSMGQRIERYAPLSETVLCTQDCGAIIVESDGHEISVKSTRKARRDLF
jgi:competence protein ComEC